MNQQPGFHPRTDIPRQMRAMRIHRTGLMSEAKPAMSADLVAVPTPGNRQVLIEIHYCGVCHTELDEIEGRASPPHLPVIPGHQVVGRVAAEGRDCELSLLGQCVGVAWIHSSCGRCHYCRSGAENLCASFQACGKDHDGGYAEYMVVAEDFVHPIPAGILPQQAAPLLCAGAVGYRSLSMTELASDSRLGLTGFGSSGRLVLQMARVLYPQIPVFVFARSEAERQLALELGASWAGDTAASAPEQCDAIIDTTPAWRPVLAALRQLAPGGRLVINAIRKESGDRNLLSELDYSEQLWMEKSIRSVANVTRADVRGMLQLAVANEFSIDVQEYALEDAQQALLAIRGGDIRKTAVLNLRS
jgi:propanol-preferring alcohol dehydrogenase